MQELVEVRRRMETVRNIRTITQTMATVASAKLSRTRERAAGMRLYAERIRGIVRRQQRYLELRGGDVAALSPFMQRRDPVEHVMLLVLTSDRGMCGNYNAVVERAAVRFLRERRTAGVRVSIETKGLHGERYLRRKGVKDVLGSEGWSRAGVSEEEVDAIHARLSESFLERRCDEVWCACTEFYSPLRRYPRLVRLLPLAMDETSEETRTGASTEVPMLWHYEQDAAEIMGGLLSVFLRLQIEDVLLESFAAEQGARMITMEEATERAVKTLGELQTRYNRLRRESITSDLLGVLFASTLEAPATSRVER